MTIHSRRALVSEAPPSGLVVDQARKTGFTIRNRDELSEKTAALMNPVQPPTVMLLQTPNGQRVASWGKSEDGGADN